MYNHIDDIFRVSPGISVEKQIVHLLDILVTIPGNFRVLRLWKW